MQTYTHCLVIGVLNIQELINLYRAGKLVVVEKKVKKLKKENPKNFILYNINFTVNKNTKIKIKYQATKEELSLSHSLFIENNKNFAVINKPAGISVQSGTKSRKNIIDILRNTREFTESQPYTVHRIDKETSGVLIVAKNRKFAQLFTSLFRIRKIHKTYLGIVLGEFDEKKGTFIDDLFHYEGEKKVKTKAITHFTLINSNNNYSLLKLNPETGRKHQLRKQLLIRGFPILGDSKYRISNNKPSKKDKLKLHAYKINFSIDGTKYNYLAEPPFEFKKVLREKYLKIF